MGADPDEVPGAGMDSDLAAILTKILEETWANSWDSKFFEIQNLKSKQKANKLLKILGAPANKVLTQNLDVPRQVHWPKCEFGSSLTMMLSCGFHLRELLRGPGSLELSVRLRFGKIREKT